MREITKGDGGDDSYDGLCRRKSFLPRRRVGLCEDGVELDRGGVSDAVCNEKRAGHAWRRLCELVRREESTLERLKDGVQRYEGCIEHVGFLLRHV